MQIQNFTYTGLLLITLIYPLLKSFESKIQFYKKFRYIFPAIIITAIPFLVWDVIFESYHIWQFNPDYTLGVNILGLPVEEWLFFVVIPYACFFIYEVAKYFLNEKKIPFIHSLNVAIAFVLLIISLWNANLDYTFVCFLLGSVILLGLYLFRSLTKKISAFYHGFLISILPFLLINGALTKIPVVIYNNAENLSFRIYTIPIEDMVYLLSLLFINFAIYEYIRDYAEKRKPQSKRVNR